MDEPILHPRPQWLLRRGGAPFVLAPTTPIVASNDVLAEAAHLQRWLQADCGLAQPLRAGPGPAIQVGRLGEPALAAELARRGTRVDSRAAVHEGYVLDVRPEGILVAGHDAAGAFYGLQLLRQLIEARHGELCVGPIAVHDWPYKRLRGVHLYMPPRAQLPFFGRLLEVLASLRFNTIFLEVGGGMRYDRHPEINRGWEDYVRRVTALPGFVNEAEHGYPFPKDSTHYELAGGSCLEKDEVRGLIAQAEALHIEVLPEVQSLSHSYYLCCPHPEIAENAADPFPDTYCPSNPASYQLLFEVLDEVIDVFHPRLVHTGHDELYTLGVCPRCRGKSGAELLAGDLTRIHAYLAERGIRMALWGDKLMNIIVGGRSLGGREYTVEPGTWFKNTEPYSIIETYPAIECVPKDLLILNWYWSVDPQATRYFAAHGFEQIYGNFYHHGGRAFQGWGWQAADPSVQGAEVSTWCEVSEAALGHNACIFNMAFSAQPLWWNGYSDLERERLLGTIAALQPRHREQLSGRRLPRRAPGATMAPCPLPAAGAVGIEGLPHGAATLAGVAWRLGAPGANAQAVDCAHPAAAPIPVQARAAGLQFLHHCRCQRRYFHTYGDLYIVLPTPEGVLGRYIVTYSDGSQEHAEIQFGENIANWSHRFGEHITACPYWAEPAWEGRDEQGRPIVLYRYEWTNPHPEQEISTVQLEWAGGEGEMRLAGLTRVELA
jgi:hypothetical protein